MAIIRQRGGSLRPGYTHKTYLLYSRRGKLVAAGWPRKRGRPRDEYLLGLTERMKTTVAHIKTLKPFETIPLEEAVRAHNKSVRGLKGAAAARTRDIIHANVEGRAWMIDVVAGPSSAMAAIPPGTQLWPRAAAWDVSDALDWTQPERGALLVRTPEAWLPTHQCKTGAIFTMPSTDFQNGFCPPPSTWGSERSMANELNATEQQVQRALDTLGQLPGSIMFRNTDHWEALLPGNPGDVLAINAAGLPEWVNPDTL